MLYSIEIRGTTPYLMHADNVLASDMVGKWRKDPKNKSVSVPGDDRSPAWSWHAYLHHNNEFLCIPSTAIMGTLRKVGADMNMKGKKTFKAATQYGIIIREEMNVIKNNGQPIPLAPILASKGQGGDVDFDVQNKLADDMGFELFVQRVAMGNSKHVRVRPRFKNWSANLTLSVTEQAITTKVLEELFNMAGERSGLGNWRPSSPKSPGQHGLFEVSVKQL